jgi:replicative DNA helicase
LATTDYSLDRGLPASVDAERSILGAILLDAFSYSEASSALLPDHFSLDSHRRIYSRMLVLGESGRAIDLISLAEELSKNKELEAVGGVAYLSSLTDGVPKRPSIEQHIRIVQDKALLRGLIHAANNAITRALDQGETAAEILESTEAEIFRLSESRLSNTFSTIPEIVRDSFGTLEKLYERGQRITGLATHFDELDSMTSGLQPSDLVIVAARPSMGKTSFAMNIVENAAVLDQKVVAVFSLEMSKESLLLRMLCSQARVDAHKLRTGFLGRDDFQKLGRGLAELAQAPIFIDDTPGISVQELRAKSRRLLQQKGRLDLIVVDYLQLMAATPVGSGKRYENRTQEVSAISRGLKAVAKELRVPVIALSQLSRAPESRGDRGHRPQLADLRESGSIEQDADLVGFIFREEVYKPDDPDLEGIAEFIIGKQRNGPIGTVKLAFIKSSTRFDNLAYDPGGGSGE